MLQYNDFSMSGRNCEPNGNTMTDVTLHHDPVQNKADPDDALFNAIGRLIYSWGKLESQLEGKIGQLRKAAGDIRIAGARTKPTIGKMLAELRAIISLRNRRDNRQLAEITQIECVIQKIDMFRMLVIQGFQSPADPHETGDRPFRCRDTRNNVICISLEELNKEVSRLDDCRERLLAL
ncbi:MAG: hypothetical protein JJE34_03655 [Alphaproteobacteria bacterium]|nr:hypothetical protein [Alphaproteobacteria bacterium]